MKPKFKTRSLKLCLGFAMQCLLALLMHLNSAIAQSNPDRMFAVSNTAGLLTPSPFLMCNPNYPSTTSSNTSLHIGLNYLYRRERAILFGGNLCVGQGLNTYGDYLGKWSFKGAWEMPYQPTGINWVIPGKNYLVDYHRWGNYMGLFGLRERASYMGQGEPSASNPDGDIKDAILSWGYEFGRQEHERSRLIFQSVEGVDPTGFAGPNGVVLDPIEREHATILPNGNFGLGISAPIGHFHIMGDAMNPNADPVVIDDAGGTTNYIFKNNGDVGFGVGDNPTAAFEYRNRSNSNFINTVRDYTNSVIYQSDKFGRFSFNAPINTNASDEIQYYFKGNGLNSNNGQNYTFLIEDNNNVKMFGLTPQGHWNMNRFATSQNIPANKYLTLRINNNGEIIAQDVDPYGWGMEGNTINPNYFSNPKLGTLNNFDIDLVTNNKTAIKVSSSNQSLYIPSFSSMGASSIYPNSPDVDWSLSLIERRTSGTDLDFGALMVRNYGGGKIFYVANDGRRMLAPRLNYTPDYNQSNTDALILGNNINMTGATIIRSDRETSSFGGGVELDGNLTILPGGKVGCGLIPSIPATTLSGINGVGFDLGSNTFPWRQSHNLLGSWTSSDRRLKDNINKLDFGLSTIKKLNPVAYSYKQTDGMTHYGFIAQDLKEIFPNSIVKGTETDSTYYSVNYDEFIPILTKSIQEQQQIIDTLKQQISLLISSSKIKDEFKTPRSQKEVLNQAPILFQNSPNPFNGITFIDYFLPGNANNAFIKVVDNNGKLIKAFALNNTGYGQVELECFALASGIYHYSLIIDSKIIDSKSMVLNSENR